MEKNIWILNSNKIELIEAQRLINADGGLRAFPMLSFASIEKAMNRQLTKGDSLAMPSLIVIDYDTEVAEDYKSLTLIQQQAAYAGVPLFFMVALKSKDLDEECYARGATVVIRKPFSAAAILRIERTAWQHEMTKNYENILQKQANELAAAKEINRLNEKLRTRNELLHQIFGRYFSDEVVDIILDNPEGAALGGVKRETTVMMADLRGFTSISDKLQPEVVTDMLNHFLGKMTDIISSHKGTVIEFIGDAILAVFGAPLESDTQVEDAVAAAISMQNKMSAVNKYNTSKGYPDIEMGIGLHKGDVFIGNIGSENMMRYNVIGQAVNLCSRIESYSVGGQVLVSGSTIEKVKDEVSVNNTFDITTKGVDKAIPICEVVGIDGTYECVMEYMEYDEQDSVKEQVIFNLYVILEKQITTTPIITKLHTFSRKRAKVMLKAEDSLEVYDNVEIWAVIGEDTIFSHVYAKVVAVKGKEATLHFTYVTNEFMDFYSEISS